MKKYSIGIIGGKGIMGKFFESVFKRHEIDVKIWSRSSEISLEEFCTFPDIIIVSVPIDKTVEIIEKISHYISPSQCITDITSVKVPAMNAMKKSGKKYFGMHPMFAPPLSGKMEGQNVIFCSGNAKKEEIFLKEIFRAESAFLLDMTAKEHDKIMSIVQGLSHFLDIVFIQTLHKQDINLNKIFSSRSPAYALKMMLSGRTLYQDANLYGNIQIQNPENITTLQTFFDEAEKLFSVVQDDNLEKFTEIFNNQKKFLGEYGKKSQKESDIVIDFLAKRVLKKRKTITISGQHNNGDVGILGPINTFSHIAAQKFLGEDIKFSLYPTISSVFTAFEKKEISEIFVPIENLLHGSVAESLDGICKIQLEIQALYEMHIIPSLFAKEETKKEEISEIFSHPQSLAQCSEFLEKNYPNAHITPVSSTAEAITRMNESLNSAAIAPKEQINTQGIVIIENSIANQYNNATRFAYLSKKKYKTTQKEKSIQGAIVFSFAKDSPGNMESVLHLFTQYNINLTKLESRPTGKSFGDYIFFVTYENIIDETIKKEFFHELKKITFSYSFLGEFGLY